MNDKITLIVIYVLFICIIIGVWAYCVNRFVHEIGNKYSKMVLKVTTEKEKLQQELMLRNQELKVLRESLFKINQKNKYIEKSLSTANYIGEFKITYYNICKECTGKLDGITASGNLVKENYTIASDWSVLPPGTKVFIEGIGIRTVEDKGGAVKGNHIDVYLNTSDDEIKELGVKTAKVYLLGGEEALNLGYEN